MIDEGNQRLTNVRSRLPDLKLPAVGGPDAVPIRPPGRRAPFLVLLHGSACVECRAYVTRLAHHREEIETWDGHVAVVLPTASVGDWPGEPLPFPILIDVNSRLATASGVEAPAVIIADQWAEIHSAEPAGEDHRFPAPEELAEWAKFLAIQCPECEGEAL